MLFQMLLHLANDLGVKEMLKSFLIRHVLGMLL